jgi:hypothetical protein
MRFREEGLYAFRFDLNNDAREELSFKVRFGGVAHEDEVGPRHVQNFEILRVTGAAAPEIQVSRWGLPLISNIFMPDADMKEQFNRSTPADDQTKFINQVYSVVEKLGTLAGSTVNPGGYGN